MRRRILLATGLGLVASALLLLVVDVPLAVISGITVAELSFLLRSWWVLWPKDAEATREHAGDEDLDPAVDTTLVAVLSALAVISIVVLHLGSAGHEPLHSIGAAVTLLGVFGAWASVHLTYAVRYAHRFYAAGGGLDFSSDLPPRYSDFLYVSYSVGMTYGITDTDTTDPVMRGMVLRHALLSFAFGMIVLGAAVNLVAGALGLA